LRQAIRTLVGDYTSTSPATIPHLQISPAEQERIAKNIWQETEKLLKGGGSQPLQLDETELNVLMAESPQLKSYGKEIYLQPSENSLKAQVSLPLDQFKFWQEANKRLASTNMSGRYLNGTATFDLSITNGELRLILRDLIANGKSVPATFINRVKAENLAQEANQSPTFKAAMEQIQNIEVKNSNVVVRFAPKSK
jgi:hypothetical protein